ncbi:MAG: hypothetical protein FWC13_12705 [Oscillospiraceae bacterium]|nr:hypothetical protein [Oscillospiraceae bacterium]
MKRRSTYSILNDFQSEMHSELSSDSLELTAKPNNNFLIKSSDPILGIVSAVLIAVVFLAFPYILGGAWTSDGSYIPMFNTEVVRSLWLPILLWTFFRISMEVIYLIEKQYNPRVALITIMLNAVTAILSFIILWDSGLICTEFLSHKEQLTNSAIATAISYIPMALLVLATVLLIVETVTAVSKGMKAGKEGFDYF